jgi:UDP-N-acetylglucosamine 2-epimerase (non-hydrolysing)
MANGSRRMKRVMLIFGTRPEAIKMVALARCLAASRQLQPVICVTAQHREMLDQILGLFSLVPDYDLNLMKPGQTLGDLSARILSGLESVFASVNPDAVLVQGDTTSTFCGALSSFYHRVPVGHIEAGLRTGDLASPFPEELNRVLTTRIARWHFAATEHNRQTLLREDVPDDSIFVTGNPVIDALLTVRDSINQGTASDETLRLIETYRRPYILITGHRRESFGDGFLAICRALAAIARDNPALDLIYPVHLNPNVQKPVHDILGNIPNVHLIPPQSYEPFVGLMANSRFIITDSGGVQEEAPSLGKPVLVMRDKTERVESLEGGVRLVGTDEQKIYQAACRLIEDGQHYREMAEAINPYGSGKSAEQIVQILESQL